MSSYKSIGECISVIDNRNSDGRITRLLGLSIDKCYIPSVANIIGTDLKKYKVLRKGQFACSLMQVSRDQKVPIAMYADEVPAIISPAYITFNVSVPNVLLPEYLDLWFKRVEFDREATFYAIGGVRGSLDWEDFCNMRLPVPSISEQCRIVRAYHVILERIELLQKINRNLEKQVQTIYKSWFIDFEPWGGVCPTAWKKGTLKELLVVKYGKDHKTLSDGSYPVFGSGGVMRYVESYLYDKESVLIPRKGSLNNVLYVDEPFWSVDTMFYTQMRRKNVAKYVYHFIKNLDLASMDSGSAVPSMTTNILNSLEILMPTEAVLEDFDNIVSSFYRHCSISHKEKQRLAQLRDVLLPKLMSGKLDVSELDI